MANLINPKDESKEKFNPNVNNIEIKAQASTLAKGAWYVSWILIIPIIIHVIKRNNLLRNQFSINETASGIDVQLQKRRDTLIKLVDATKSYVNYEKSILKDLTEMRKSTFKGGIGSGKLNSLAGQIFAVAENYPQLKTDSLAKETMEQAAYLESEIAAARRLYNSEVIRFNTQLFTWPSNVISSSMGLETISIFKASSNSKKDVKLKF